MFALNSKLRASALCLLLVVFTACEYAPAPTSTPLPTATSTVTAIPTATAVVTVTPTPEATATLAVAVTEAATAEATAGSAATSEPAAAITGHVTVSSTRIRDTPSIRGKALGQLKRDDRVLVIGITADGGYLHIQSADGSLDGWTSKQSIALDNPLADIPEVTPPAS